MWEKAEFPPETKESNLTWLNDLVSNSSEHLKDKPKEGEGVFQKVETKGDLVQQKDSEDQAEQKDKNILQGIVSVPPDKLGLGIKETRSAAEAFLSSNDKEQAMQKLQPRFEGAITQSDKDFSKSMGENWSNVLVARRDLGMINSQLMGVSAKAGEILRQMPPEDRARAMAIMTLLADEKIDDKTKSNLREKLADQPGLLSIADSAAKLQESRKTAEESLAKAQEPLLKSAMEQSASRLVYAQALQQSGRIGESFRVKQEGEEVWKANVSKIMATPREPVKPPVEV
ncbi:MAG: hypothetical protein K2Y32_02760 [Candidatus Obscuribacterales bacterium]|nr:hypothetical protein [Candidatus Obscuribacterales bacterium]